MALAIKEYEGWTPVSRSFRNNNAGNCRYSSVGYLPIYEPVGKDSNNFAIFKNYDTGFLYLCNLLRYKIEANPNQTLLQFMEVYAPVTDGNDPVKYAAFIGRRLGISVDYQVKNLIV